MLKKMIQYIVLSDLHLGNDNNPTTDILKGLRKLFTDNHNLFKKLDYIFIAGDLYDKLLPNHSSDYILVNVWVTELIVYCNANNIKLRILEGTASHDWGQGKMLSKIIDKLDIKTDFKYINNLYIEKDIDTGLNILYLPDELNHDASKTYEQVKKLLFEHKLNKVDIVIMHGQFHYQIPMVRLESSHNEEDYLSITEHYIHPGHIHIPSVYDRIIAQGSVDRIAHNEEEDKGLIWVRLANKHREYRFIKNKYAKVFKTLRYETKDVSYILDNLNKELKKIPKFSNIRILVPKDNLLKKSIKDIANKFLLLTIKIEYIKEHEEKIKLLEEIKIESFEITPNNIKELLYNELSKYNLTEKEKKILDTELDNIV